MFGDVGDGIGRVGCLGGFVSIFGLDNYTRGRGVWIYCNE